MTILAKLGMVAVVFLLGLFSGMRIEHGRNAIKTLDLDREMQRAIGSKALKVNELSDELEKTRTARARERKTVDDAIAHAVDPSSGARFYDGDCLDDDGLRITNASLGGFAIDPGQLDTTLPAAATASGRKAQDRPEKAQ